ncbi:MAG: hypothetical protein OMOMHJEC_01347 [Xanthomonadales bacterium]|nr:hypothetical protein [Xanthomonadales bacterium]
MRRDARQREHDACGVGVVHTALVVLGGVLLRLVGGDLGERRLIAFAQGRGQRGIGFGAPPQPPGEVLGAVHLRGLVRQHLAPDGAVLLGRGLGQLHAVVGAGQLQREPALVVQQREVERAPLDGEAVAAEHQRIAGGAEFEAIAQIAQPTLLEAAQPAGEFVGLHRRSQRAQLGDLRLGALDQGIAGEEGVQLLGLGDLRDPPRDAVEHPRDRVGEPARALVALRGDLLAARREGLQRGLATGGEFHQEGRLRAEAAFQLLDAAERARERFVDRLGRVRARQQIRQRLLEHRQLGTELEALFLLQQPLAARAQRGANAVDLGVQRGGLAEQGRALLGVGLLEARDQFGQAIQRFREAIELLADRRQRAGALRRIDGGGGLGQALAQAGEGGRIGEELERALADAVQFLDDARVLRIDRGDVDVRLLAQAGQFAALALQAADRLGEVLGCLPQQRGDTRQQLAHLLGGGRHRLARRLLAALQFLEGVERLAAAAPEQRHVCGDAADLLFRQPWMRVGAARGELQQALVGGLAVRVLGEPRELAQLGERTHHVRVAEAAEQATGLRLRTRVLVRGKGRAPQLHHVQARGVGPFRRHQQQPAVVEARVAGGQQGLADRAVDQVVGQQRVVAAGLVVEHVEHVLAARRAHRALQPVTAEVVPEILEMLELAGLEVVAAGEHDAVVLGQFDAGIADLVDAHHLLQALVVDEVADHVLAVGPDRQHDQRAQIGIADLGVRERLVLVVDRLAVDAKPGLGVVLDLDREVATGGLDEHGVEDVHVRMAAEHMLLAPHRQPLEAVRRGQHVIALAAVVDVGQRPAALDRETEHALVAGLAAGAEDQQQALAGDPQLVERGRLVVGVKLAEVGDETLLGEETACDRDRLHFRAIGAVDEAVQAEDVVDPGLLLQPERDLVAEQQQLADAHDVARHAVVLGARGQPRQQLRLDAPESGDAPGIQRLGPGTQRLGGRGEALLEEVEGGGRSGIRGHPARASNSGAGQGSRGKGPAPSQTPAASYPGGSC